MNLIDRLASFWKTLAIRAGIISSLFRFLWRNKLWWLIPVILMLVVFFLIMVFAQSSPLGPFIYTLF